MNRKNSTGLYIFLIAGILILLNILGSRYFLRLDLTEDQRYTLSEATKNILEGLDQPLTVTAYFSEDLPPNIDKTRRDFKDLLSEYATRSRGNIVYEFINPNEEDVLEEKAVQNGIRPVVINVREKDQSVQKKAFLGALLRYGEETEVIPFVQPGSAMEYSLSSGIKKLTADTKSLIGFIQGHGEPSISMMQQAMQSLEVLNQVESVNLTDSTYLTRFETLVWVAPSDSIPQQDLQMLDEYLAGGGNMVVAINRVDGDLNQGRGFEQLNKATPESVVARDEDRWEHFEVTDSTGTRVKLFSGEELLADLVIGKFSFSERRKMTSYVRLAGEKNVYGVDGALGMSFNRNVKSFRDKTVLDTSSDNWTKLTFDYPADSSFVLQKTGNQWMVGDQPADSAAVVEYFRTIRSLNEGQFAENEPEKQPTHQLRIEGKDGMPPIEISGIFSEAEHFYIKSSENPLNLFDSPDLAEKLFVSRSRFGK